MFKVGESGTRKVYLVGSGIGSLAAAAYLIRDGGIRGEDIVVYEEASQLGGALDAHGGPETGYFMSGSRMFEHKYNATFDLFSFIPSVVDPNVSVKQNTELAEQDAVWHHKARLVDRDCKIIDFHELGFSERDRIDMVALIARTEHSLDSKRISDCFDDHFFETNFWFEWCFLSAFERWHSAIEFRRYLLRFMHHFSTIDTQEGVFRTRYNQYDSMAVPLLNWLRAKGVEFRLESKVSGLGFESASDTITVNSLEYVWEETSTQVAVGPDDLVFVTNGSMTAGKSFGSMTSAPAKDFEGRDGAWKL